MPLFVDVFFIIFSSFDCILPSSFHWLSSQLNPPSSSLFLFTASLRLARQASHWSLLPAAKMCDRPLRSAEPHSGMQGAKNDLVCWKGFSYTHARPITVYSKHKETKTLSTCINIHIVDMIIVEGEGGLLFPFLIPPKYCSNVVMALWPILSGWKVNFGLFS